MDDKDPNEAALEDNLKVMPTIDWLMQGMSSISSVSFYDGKQMESILIGLIWLEVFIVGEKSMIDCVIYFVHYITLV